VRESRTEDRRLTSLISLLEVAKRLNTSLDLDEIVRNILRSARDVMHADAACVLLREDDELVFTVADGGASEQLTGLRPARIAVGDGIAGWVAANGKPLRIDDVYNEPRFCRDVDERTGYRTRSLLCVPLIIEGRVLGVAEVINKRGREPATLPEPFNAADLEIFTAFCELAALAVQRAQLHRQLLDRHSAEDELTMARELQQRFLCFDPACSAALRLAARNLPAREVSGDFFDAFAIEEGRYFLTIGDVAGKGTAAALRMARFVSEFRFVAELAGAPVAALQRVSEILERRGDPFVSVLLVDYQPALNRAQLVNAGHPPAVLVGTHTFEWVGHASGPPLGIMPTHQYRETTIDLSEGRGLLLFTDGLTEARNPAHGEYGQARLLAQLEQHGLDLDLLLADVSAFTAGMPQHDDLTLVALSGARGRR
jgi:sigma-B regulation protein RsbU (phosphoserine phosphatase)